MIVQCGHCGAPLDVKESSTIIKCRYCGTSNERASVRTIAERTPDDFQPPKKWTPPAEFEANSSNELTYKARGGGCVLGIVLVSVVIPLAIGAGTFIDERTGFLHTNPSRLAQRTTLDGDVATLASAFGGTSPTDTSVDVPLHSALYERLAFSYDAKSPEHPTSFVFLRRGDKAPCDPQVLSKLATLRGGLDATGGWRWEHISISCNKESGAVSAYVRTDNNPVWQKQLDAAWKIALAAVFGFDVAPTPAEMLDLLGAGYPLASVGSISPLTWVDVAAATVRKQFPGAVFETQNEVNATIPVDHPIFRSVKLRWRNARGATLDMVDFAPVGEQKGFAPKRDALATCMSSTLGAARVSDADYMTKTKAYAWSLPSMSLNLHESGMTISMMPGQPPDAATYANAMHAIDACH